MTQLWSKAGGGRPGLVLQSHCDYMIPYPLPLWNLSRKLVDGSGGYIGGRSRWMKAGKVIVGLTHGAECGLYFVNWWNVFSPWELATAVEILTLSLTQVTHSGGSPRFVSLNFLNTKMGMRHATHGVTVRFKWTHKCAVAYKDNSLFLGRKDEAGDPWGSFWPWNLMFRRRGQGIPSSVWYRQLDSMSSSGLWGHTLFLTS